MNLKINGKIVEAAPGEMVLDVLKRDGILTPTLCQDEGLSPFSSCRLCLVLANGKPVVACSTPVSEKLNIETDVPIIEELRKSALDLLLSDHYADCVAPCSLACPSKVDVQAYVGFAARGEFDSALRVIRDGLALPSCLGRVCPAFCEEEQCRRALVEEPISIRNIKKFIADIDLFSQKPYIPPQKDSTGKRVAIVGSGPAGLSCAYFLAQFGHKPVIFESLPEPGGMLRYGIPSYRLPKDILDKEIDLIRSLGVEIKTGITIGNGMGLTQLREGYDAVFIAVGAGIGRSMRIPGKDLNGVFQGVSFLRKFILGEPLDIGRRVVVVGGGNTAIDSARTALRMGADVRIVYRRSRKEMPAHHIEIEDAEVEGIVIDLLTNPVKIIGNGRVEEIECIRMELGEPDESGRRRPVPVEGSEFKIKADSIIMAVGQSVDLSFNTDDEITTTKWRSLKVGSDFLTNLTGVYAGGDAVRGPATVVEACYDGREAARCIDSYLRGLKPPEENYEFISKKGEFSDIPKKEYEEYEKRPRLEPKKRKARERKGDFNEIEAGFTEGDAIKEAERCIECGCTARYACDLKQFSTIYKADQKSYTGESHQKSKDRSHPLIIRDKEKCILCGSCVRACDEVRCIGAFGFIKRGFETRIGTFFNKPLLETECESCGNCVDICPTGALWDKNILLKKPIPLDCEKIETTCPFCGYGCPIAVSVCDERLEKIEGIGENQLCVRGKFGGVLAQDRDRLLEPIIKSGKKIDIPGAVEITRERLKEISKRYGHDSVGLFISPRSLTEEIREIARFAETIGTKNLFTFSTDIARIERHQDVDWDKLSSYDTISVIGFDFWLLRSVPGLKIRQAGRDGTRLIIVGQDDMLSVYNPEIFIPIEDLKSKIFNLKSELESAKNPLILFNPGIDLSFIRQDIGNIPTVPVYTKANMRTLVDMGIGFPPQDKKFKGIFIFGEDPVGLSYERGKIEDYFRELKFLAVCDLFLTETGKLADIVIPSASYAEIDGSFTNIMGKVNKVMKVIPPLTGFTNLEILELLNNGTQLGKRIEKLGSTTSHVRVRIRSNADSFEDRVRERLKQILGS